MAELFARAQEVVNEFGQSGQKLTNDEALQIYAFFKQGTTGDVNINRPGMFDLTGKAKWDAWNAIKGLSQEEARARYVQTARTVLPAEWASRIA